MYGCGLRIGEALAVRTRCRMNRDSTLRVREQVNLVAQLRPTMTDGGMTQVAQHESSVDGVTWTPSMDVVLRKCG